MKSSFGFRPRCTSSCILELRRAFWRGTIYKHRQLKKRTLLRPIGGTFLLARDTSAIEARFQEIWRFQKYLIHTPRYIDSTDSPRTK